jgi:cell division protein FtsI (penicillin-binding protein 3)/stage V sporulation protein D (sporulation-specific penicillin-binding protein)
MALSSRKRAMWIGGIVASCFTVFSFRLVELQVARSEHYRALAFEKHSIRQTIHARRGGISDVNGVPLASNEPVKTVVVDASVVKNAEVLAEALAKHLELPLAAVRERLDKKVESGEPGVKKPCRYIVIKHEVSESVAEALAAELEKKKVRGMFFEQDAVRVYPNGSMLSHVVGYVNRENKGMEGVERSMDEWLKGHDGFRYTERNRRGSEMVAFRRMERPPRDGSTIRLTVDMALQDIVESEMNAAMKQFRPKMATCILMRPTTGEVLAMANRPHYDLNQRDGVPVESRKNRAIMDMIEPGSTFKIVTTAGALESRLVRPESGIYCEHGRFTYGGTILHDSHHGYGELSVNDIVVKSSNIGVAKLGILLGEQRLYDYIRRFGFGDRTGVQLPGEIGGIIHAPSRWSKISITHIPMGHEVGATPMQVVNAMCTIANRGKLLTPQIISSITDAAGTVVATYPRAEVRQVISPEVAESLVSALKEVVSKKGTAALAHVPGFEVAGKTGTAQKTSPGGGYEHNKYVVSFAGFLPADKPELCCLVLLDEPVPGNTPYYGGYIAAPIFSKIAQRAARHLNLAPNPDFLKVSGSLAKNEDRGKR